jgi:hypothetical protein
MQDVSIYLYNDLKKIDCFFSLNKLIIVTMEVQTCAYTSSNVSSFNSNSNNVFSLILLILIAIFSDITLNLYLLKSSSNVLISH